MGVAETVSKGHNTGKFLAAMGLENYVLKNGVLPERPLSERAQIITGMFDSLIEQGKWGQAVKMVMANGSSGRMLFEKPEDLGQRILASASTGKDKSFDYDAWDALAANGMEDTVLQLAQQGNYGPNFLADVLSKVERSLSRKFNQIIGEKALDNGYTHFATAFRYFNAAGDRERLNALFNEYVSQGSRIPDTFKFFDMFASFAKSEPDREKRREKLTELVRSRLYVSAYEGEINNAVDCFKLFKENNLLLEPREIVRLNRHAAKKFSFYDLFPWRESYNGRSRRILGDDKRFVLLWGQLHVASQPADAYKAFTKIDYRGPERIEAARAGLALGEDRYGECTDQGLGPNEVSFGDLKSILISSQTPLDMRVNLACYLRREAIRCRRLSRGEMLKKAQETVEEMTGELRNLSLLAKNEGNHRQVYRIWMDVEGDMNEPHFVAAREALWQDAMNEVEREKLSRGSRLHFIDEKDTVGAERAYRFFMEKGLYEEAFEFGTSRNLSLAHIEEARNTYINADPIKAYGFYKTAKDLIGEERAFAALAGKFGLAVEEARGYLPHQ